MTRRTHTVRTTRWPDRDIEVDDAEFLDLTRWGQLLPRPEPEPAPVVESVVEVQAPEPAPEPEIAPEPPSETVKSPRQRRRAKQ